jgi:ATP-binding cassette subfamily B protein
MQCSPVQAESIGFALIALCSLVLADAFTLVPIPAHGAALGEADMFPRGTLDLWIWLCVRCFLLVAVFFIARIVFPTGVVDDTGAAALSDATDDEESAPLLAGTSLNAGPASHLHEHPAAAPVRPLYKDEDRLKARCDERRRRGWHRTALVALVFVVHVACNVYIAVKAMRFEVTTGPDTDDTGSGLVHVLHFLWTADPTAIAVLLSLLVLWCTLELFAVDVLIGRLVRNAALRAGPDAHERIVLYPDSDVFCATLHPHPLCYIRDTVLSTCNVCSLRFRARDRKFKCDLCDYYVCGSCVDSRVQHVVESRRAAASLPSLAAVASPTGGPLVTVGMDKTVTKRLGRMDFLRKILRIASHFWRILLVSLLCLLAAQLINLWLPKYQGHIIDNAIARDSEALKTNVTVYAVLGFGRLLIVSLRMYCSLLATRYASNTIRLMLFDGIISRDISFFDATSTGALTSRLNTDTTSMASPLSTIINSVLSNIVSLIGGSIMAFTVSWKLALLLFTVLGPIVFLTQKYAETSRRLNRQIRDSVAEASSAANQAFTNIRTVRAFAAEQQEMERYTKSINQAVDIARINAVANALMSLSTNSLDLGVLALTLGFGGYMIMNHPDELSVGELVSFQVYASMLNSAYRSLNDSINSLTSAAGAAERVLALIGDGERKIRPVMGAQAAAALESVAVDGGHYGDDLPGGGAVAVEFDAVTFTYPGRPTFPVLRGLTFRCAPGTVTALVGPSGSGKSTVVQLLLQLYPTYGGTIRVGGAARAATEGPGTPLSPPPRAIATGVTSAAEGEASDMLAHGITASGSGSWDPNQLVVAPLTDVDRAAWLDGVAVVAQDTQLFSTTVLENITYAAPSRVCDADGRVPMEAVIAAAKAAQAHDFIMKLPEGYQTPVGERGCTLSGGQRQRLAIARALLRRPRLLLLDEATSALDNESEALVQQALDDLLASGRRNRCTVLVIAHRLSTIQSADRIVVVQDGKAVQEGNHASLVDETDGLYAQYVARGFPAGAPAAAGGRGGGTGGRGGGGRGKKNE